MAIDKSINESQKALKENEMKESNINDKIYNCPKCNTSINSNQISYDAYKTHFKYCNVDKYNVCMFCLTLFHKTDDNYIPHINCHLASQF